MNHNFHYRMIKARVAETIVKELFLVCGFNVFDYGMERSLPTITGRLNNDNSDTAMQIRKMPDFVVQAAPPCNELFYVEVKYRKSSRFPTPSDNIENYSYTNAWFIVVSKIIIRCIISHAQILAGKKKSAQTTISWKTLMFLNYINKLFISSRNRPSVFSKKCNNLC